MLDDLGWWLDLTLLKSSEATKLVDQHSAGRGSGWNGGTPAREHNQDQKFLHAAEHYFVEALQVAELADFEDGCAYEEYPALELDQGER